MAFYSIYFRPDTGHRHLHFIKAYAVNFLTLLLYYSIYNDNVRHGQHIFHNTLTHN